MTIYVCRCSFGRLNLSSSNYSNATLDPVRTMQVDQNCTFEELRRNAYVDDNHFPRYFVRKPVRQP